MSNELALKEKDEGALTIQDALLEIVQRTDIDPDRLEKFLDLQIKMEERQQKQAFQKALAGFQKECPVIPKTRKINFQSNSGKTTKYNYSPLDEIVSIIKPIMAKWGLSYSFDINKGASDQDELITTVYHEDGFEKSFSYFFFALHDDTRMNQSQRVKSSITYAKRAGLENALGIVTAEEDDDARRAVDTPVSDEQIKTINKLMEKTNTGEKRLLAFLKVDSLDELSAYDAKKAIKALKEKRTANVPSSGL